MTPEFTIPRPPQGVSLLIGLDVGSTTVKAVAVDAATGAIGWSDYQRHETRQYQKALALVEQALAAYPGCAPENVRIGITGSGGSHIGELLGARFVQEVSAVTQTVERLYPDVRSVVELGGQDAKIVIIKEDPETGRRVRIPTMNDKCAGGTGAVIDKVAAKLGLPAARVATMGFEGVRTHPVAGKCGVFAETDINGLQKQGVPAEELMASLFASLVQQNISVLTRGHTLAPRVLLLGGPNHFIRGMRECWRDALPRIWRERGLDVPDAPVETLVHVPEDAQYFGALGAVDALRGALQDDPEAGRFTGTNELRWYIEVGRGEERARTGSVSLANSGVDLGRFRAAYDRPAWSPPALPPDATVRAYIGVDGGSTSTKAVLVDEHKQVIAKAYRLSGGNPIEDTREVLAALRSEVEQDGRRLEVLGVGTTGYAKDMLKDIIGADVALVETVAHTQSGLHVAPDTDVICDVGGQDIKVILLKNGTVKDFKLNTQCSAGNGYYLQATAESFGVPVTEYAATAFGAARMPRFGYGCAVFMQSDIVDFQRQGWQPDEILAGLAAVLPKNVWLYVCQMPNLPKLGSRFLLQGGTQRNLAAVKAQVDFIRERFAGSGVEPEVTVHQHCGEAGAIGCAFEARRLHDETGRASSFIGFDQVASIAYRTTRDERTRCTFCGNCCLRTFIDFRTTDSLRQAEGVESVHDGKPRKRRGPLPLEPGERRVVLANCEKGAAESARDMRAIADELETVKAANPNLSAWAAEAAFKPVTDGQQAGLSAVADSPWWRLGRTSGENARAGRENLRIGIPRVLNLYAVAPFFIGWFQSAGVAPGQLVWSDVTSGELYRRGAKRGSIDPCYPSKVAIPHVHQLLFEKHAEAPLTHIFFPMVETVPSRIHESVNSLCCPTTIGTPAATWAAFVKEGDLFAQNGVDYKRTFVTLGDEALAARQMMEDWGPVLGLSEAEADQAAQAGFAALRAYQQELRARGRAVLDELEREDRLGVVLLARPYHNDPGVNHGICEEFQKLGYPVLTQDSLPLDPDVLERVFGPDIAAGDIPNAQSIADVWKNSYSENSSRKVWAAKFVARHPNLVALDLSSFKCGHDAPLYTLVEEIVEASGTPFFYFRDIDENKPAGSIRIRIETVAYFLQRRHEALLAEKHTRAEIEQRLQAYERRLRMLLEEQGDTAALV